MKHNRRSFSALPAPAGPERGHGGVYLEIGLVHLFVVALEHRRKVVAHYYSRDELAAKRNAGDEAASSHN